MNEHAKMIRRLDKALEANADAQAAVWARFSTRGEFGDIELTKSGKRQMDKLVAERKRLEESANAAYRM